MDDDPRERRIDNNELKRRLMLLIGDCLDEECFSDLNSFIEMDHQIIHVAIPGREAYVKVTLTMTTDKDYFLAYTPTDV